MIAFTNESPIVRRLFELTWERGVSPKKVTEDIGISNSSFTDWKKGRANPGVDTLVKLASYFGVSLNYLIIGEEREPSRDERRIVEESEPVNDEPRPTVVKIPEMEISLHPEDGAMLSKFRMIPAECQGKVMLYMDGMLAALESDSGGPKDGREHHVCM